MAYFLCSNNAVTHAQCTPDLISRRSTHTRKRDRLLFSFVFLLLFAHFIIFTKYRSEFAHAHRTSHIASSPMQNAHGTLHDHTPHRWNCVIFHFFPSWLLLLLLLGIVVGARTRPSLAHTYSAYFPCRDEHTCGYNTHPSGHVVAAAAADAYTRVHSALNIATTVRFL